jgi:hypothetical protein
MLKQRRTKADRDAKLNEFVETMGRNFENYGLPRIAGRIFGFLIITKDPASLQSISKHLEVSRGSVSTNTRLLEYQRLVESYRVVSERQLYYRLTDKPFISLIYISLGQINTFYATACTANGHLGRSGPKNLRKMENQCFRAVRRFSSTLRENEASIMSD